MFCPNCGTQNSETASTCTKCGFNLKGAAAPKFKGTMLMNQAPGAPAPGGAPPPGAPRPPQQPGMPPVMPVNQGLAGTVVGVPPAGLGAAASLGAPPAPPPPAAPPSPYGAPPPAYGAPPQPAYGAPPQPGYPGAPGGQPPQPAFGGAAGAPGGYAPPGQPAGGVNPLGGTMAIDQMPGFNAPAPGAPYGAPAPQPGFPPPQGAPPGGGFGAPGPDQGYGGQPGGYGGPPQGQQPGAYGAPPQDPYGAQPGGFGGPPPGQPGGYGGPPPGGQPGGYGGPQPGYGAPPQQTPGQEVAAAGAAFGAAAQGAFGQMMAPAPAAGSKPTVRNPVMTLVISYAIMFGVNIVGSILVGILAAIISPALASLSGLFSLAAFLGYGFYQKSMLAELNAYNQNPDFKWWFILVPILNIYFCWLKVPEAVTAAKTKAGIIQAKPTKSIVFYIFLFPFALANDLNDIAQP